MDKKRIKPSKPITNTLPNNTPMVQHQSYRDIIALLSEGYAAKTYKDSDARYADKRKDVIKFAREATINHTIVRACRSILSTYVFGKDGAQPKINCTNNPELSKQYYDEFVVWLNQIDGRGKSMTCFERDIYNEIFDTGNAFLLVHKPTPTRGFKIKTIRDEDVVQIYNDEFGKPCKFEFKNTIYDNTKGEFATIDDTVDNQIDNDRFMIFLNAPLESTATRGIPTMAGAFDLLEYTKDIIRGNAISAAVAAQYAVVITSEQLQDAYGEQAATTDAQNPPQMLSGEAGQILVGQPGQSIDIVKNNLPDVNLANGIRPILQQICAAANLPLDMVIPDYSKQNYSSNRAMLLQLQAYIGRIQSELIEQFYKRLWMWFYGYSKGVNGKPADDQYLNACTWVMPTLTSLDPAKEANANVVRLTNGLASHKQIALEDGHDFEEMIADRVAETDYIASKAVELQAKYPNLNLDTLMQRIGGNSYAPTPTVLGDTKNEGN